MDFPKWGNPAGNLLKQLKISLNELHDLDERARLGALERAEVHYNGIQLESQNIQFIITKKLELMDASQIAKHLMLVGTESTRGYSIAKGLEELGKPGTFYRDVIKNLPESAMLPDWLKQRALT